MATITGTPQDDQDGAALTGTADADEYFGLAGNDLLIGSAGNDTLDGGDGEDTVSYADDIAGISADLSSGVVTDGSGGTDTLIGIERLIGTDAFGDTLTGGGIDRLLLDGRGGDDIISADNSGFLSILSGQLGNDQITNLGGVAFIDPGAGQDTITGSADFADYTIISYYFAALGGDPGSTAGMNVTFSTERGGAIVDFAGDTDTFTDVDEIRGTALADTFTGADGRQQFTGYDGNDTFDGGAGDDRVNYLRSADTGLALTGVSVNLATGLATDPFGDTDSLISIEDIRGTVFADTILGDGANNDLRGEAGDDNITGEGGNDYIEGSDGNDTIDGGADDDDLRGDAGDDSILGGEGRDDLRGGTGDDTLDGGEGTRDEARYSEASAGVNVNLTAGIASDGDGGTDTLLNIEEVRGSNFSDTITGAQDGISYLRGGAGDDEILGNSTLSGFHNDLDGGAGNDTLTSIGGDAFFQPDIGNDTVTGSSGFDVLSYFFSAGYAVVPATAGVTVTFSAEGVGTAIDHEGGADSFTGIERVEGTMLADVMTGAAGYQDFRGFAGNDTIDGGADYDLIDYSAGRGDFGGTSGGVIVDLAAGTATDAYGDTDTLINIEGVRGTNAADMITGDAVSQRLEGRDGDDTIDGGGGGDDLRGEGGNDLVLGGDGDDLLSGGSGDDVLRGGDGDDFLSGGSGDDTLDGGDGDDEAFYLDVASGVTVDLEAGTASDGTGGTDTLVSIEAVNGSNFNDVISGAVGAYNFLEGRGGDDVITGADDDESVEIYGDAGNDTLTGGTGGAYFEGGTGDDVIIGGTGAEGFYLLSYFWDLGGGTAGSGVSVVFSSERDGTATDEGGGTDTFTGIDRIEGTMNNDSFTGTTGFQDFRLQGGNDTVDGGADDDRVDYSRVRPDFGGVSGIVADMTTGIVTDAYGGTDTLINIERIRATDLSDQISGSDTNEVFEGNGGDDLILGMGGNDQLEGDSGNDTLDGGAGNDTLTGGNGADVFVIGAGNEQILITDFELGVDTLDLSAFGRGDALVALASAVAGSAILTLGDGTVITVEGEGVTPASLTESDLLLEVGNTLPTGDVIIDGQAAEGETLTANISGVSDSDGIDVQTEAFQWQRDGVDIDGATSATYQLGAVDIGTEIRVIYSYTDDLGTAESVPSSPTDLVANVNDAPTGDVVVTGTATEGETLTSDITGVVDADGIQTDTVSYQWQRDGQNISGASAQLASYVLQTEDVGAEVSVVISFTDDGGAQESVASATVTPNAIPILTTGNGDPEALDGGQGDDTLLGEGGDDTLNGAQGDDDLNGGAGIDTAVYSGDQASYTLTLSPTTTTLTDRRADGNGTDTLEGLEFLDFDTDLFGEPFDLVKFAGPAGLDEADLESFIELYIAYFNRAPDAVGLLFWGTAFATGTSLETIAGEFINQDETLATYPPTLSNAEFATAVYDNVLGRIPDQGGFDFWVRILDGGSVGRDQFILEVLKGAKAEPAVDETPEFITQQLADQQYLSDKTDIGAYFSVHKGMSDVGNAGQSMALFDGTQSGIDAAVMAIDSFFVEAQDAGTGEFLMPLLGVLDDPFMMG